MEQLDSHWTDFHEIWYLSIIPKSFGKWKSHYNLTTITGTLPEHRYTFLTKSCSFLHRVRNVSEKSCRENRNTKSEFSNFFFRKSCRLWDNVEKILSGHRRHYNTAHAHCVLDDQVWIRAFVILQDVVLVWASRLYWTLGLVKNLWLSKGQFLLNLLPSAWIYYAKTCVCVIWISGNILNKLW